MTIKLELPANEPAVLRAFGKALLELGGGAVTQAIEETEKLAEAYASLIDTPEVATPDDLKSAGAPEVDTAAAFSGAPSTTEKTTATSAGAETETAAQKPTTGTAQTDENGVPFNVDLCANAAKPFYSSGKKKGQWKKRQGVDEGEYDAWYAASRPATFRTQIVEDVPSEPSADTGAAFAGTDLSADEPSEVITNGGDLLTWISEMQTAGRLNNIEVTQAYSRLGLTVNDLFGDNAEDATRRIHAEILRNLR